VKTLPLIACCTPLAQPTLTEAQAAELEGVFKALADRHRVKILNMLVHAGEGAVCVCEFVDALRLKQPTTSYHLKQLVDAGLIVRERRGTFSYYRLAPGALARVGSLFSEQGELARAV
jgi:ArsR family transcriptional regulator